MMLPWRARIIIFVAALQGQDKEIEEAARLDGARWRQIFFSISLPLMRPVIAIALVLRGIDILTMFASPHIITQGSPGGDTETLSYFIYRTGFQSFEFGSASAASVVLKPFGPISEPFDTICNSVRTQRTTKQSLGLSPADSRMNTDCGDIISYLLPVSQDQGFVFSNGLNVLSEDSS
mgnify:CR=1 FL=1